MDFGRVITAMVTPFDEQGQIDWQRTGKLINFLIEEQGNDSLVICGTTGESPTLSDEEKIQLFEFAVKQARGRCRIIAGTGSNNTAHSIHLTKLAEEVGVDGTLLVTPYYNRPSQEGLYEHFKAIADSTSLPIMLYNVPSRTAINLSADTTVRLAQLPNVVATKESGGNLDQVTNIVSKAPKTFRVYSGDDNFTLPILSVGGYGVVSVVSHVIGKPMRQMIESFIAGDVGKAASIHGELLPIFNGLFICSNPVPVKYALRLHGIEVGDVRLPLIRATEEEQLTISELFKS